MISFIANIVKKFTISYILMNLKNINNCVNEHLILSKSKKQSFNANTATKNLILH